MTLAILASSRGSFASQNMPKGVEANPISQKVSVDGKEVGFRAFNIEGHNYFMLRDLAYVLKDTKAQFEVVWNEEKFAINLETGKKYSGPSLGFEMKSPPSKKTGYKSRAKIYKDKKQAFLLAYTIEGKTYFKLRDLAKEMDFLVDWDSKNQEVIIKSDLNKTSPEVYLVKKKEKGKKQEMKEEMLELINEARRKEGLEPLSLNNKLIEMAKFKAQDMKNLGKLSHNGSYGSFKDLLSLYEINYSSSGENILMGGSSSQQMFNMWWKSPGHRANMMNPEYKKIGIGFKSISEINRSGYWAVQEFTD